jgi:hypothetical protein
MTRDEAQPAWEIIVDKGYSDYKSLSREERVWFNLEPLTIEGLWDHYMNTGAEFNAETIEDLDYLNFKSVANLMREFNKIYFPNGVPIEPDDRQLIFDQFPEDKLEKDIKTMDDNFWEVSEELELRLLGHINSTGIGKITTPHNSTLPKAGLKWWQKLFRK